MSARLLAFRTLVTHDETGRFTQDLLDAEWKRYEVPAADRRLISELVFGTVRRRSTLDALVDAHLTRAPHEVEDDLRTLLRLGAYQLALTSGVPDHAAVHETVEVCRMVDMPRWVGLANGVLRAIGRTVTGDAADGPAADAVPLPGGDFRRLARPIFPDPAADPAGYFARGYGFPRWLADRWAARFTPAELFAVGTHLNRTPRLTLRVNPLRTTREAFLAALAGAGIGAEAGTHPQAVRLGESARVTELPGFAAGHFTVQDETAMLAAGLLDPPATGDVLDLCAAPGTKSTHLAELVSLKRRDAGEQKAPAPTVYAADASADRLERVYENAERLGFEGPAGVRIEPVAVHPSGEDIPAGPFAAVLVDAPCSNTGVLGKRPEARWRVKPHDIDELTAVQRNLLSAALDRTAVGGRVVYSTCSVEPEENGAVVAAALSGRTGWRFETSTLDLPGKPADGGFRALMVRADG